MTGVAPMARMKSSIIVGFSGLSICHHLAGAQQQAAVVGADFASLQGVGHLFAQFRQSRPRPAAPPDSEALSVSPWYGSSSCEIVVGLEGRCLRRVCMSLLTCLMTLWQAEQSVTRSLPRVPRRSQGTDGRRALWRSRPLPWDTTPPQHCHSGSSSRVNAQRLGASGGHSCPAPWPWFSVCSRDNN